MCGICGQFNYNNDNVISCDDMRSMASVLQHRGPDEEGYYVKNNIGLAHKRLKIIDLETGKQPIGNEDNSLQIIFNGEIYNFKTLRNELQNKGHVFKTKSDTEVIIHLYEEMGPHCIDKLSGMFAFAIWDDDKEELFLARDRVGKKPLYYCDFNGSFIFASEIKSLLKIANIPKVVNNNAIVQYLSISYVPPPMTIFQHIHKLLPAHFLLVNKKGLCIKRYWNLDFNQKTSLPYDECKKTLHNLLLNATEMRMVSDVPLGVFLSGGLDSSVIVALMSSISSQQIKTFSIGFNDKRFNELSYARIIANAYKTDHYEFIVEPNILPIIDNIVWHYEQPYADSSNIASYYLSELTRKHVTVALNGDGGDENFAGYPRYKAAFIYNIITEMPFKSYKILSKMLHFILSQLPEGKQSKGTIIKCKKFLNSLIHTNNPFYKKYHSWFCHFTEPMINKLITNDLKIAHDKTDYSYLESSFNSSCSDALIDKILYTDIMTYLPDDLLVKMDTATMAHSLEARSPLLDHSVLEFTATLPSHMKLNAFKSKIIFKDMFKDEIPKHILNRSKMGFGVPVGEWFHKELKTFCTHTLFNSRVKERNILDIHYIQQLINEHLSGKINHGYRLWNLLMLELWFRKFIDNDTHIC